ncbi:MAG: methanogenesis marker protein Mmp4/MtxX [Methanoculleaceae archaeon]
MNTTESWDSAVSGVKKPVVGIGADVRSDRVAESVLGTSSYVDAVCYCRPGTFPHENDFTVVECEDPCRALISSLMDGTIDAAVRGTLPANETLKVLREMSGVDHLLRMALLETPDGRYFFFAPVGVDEGWTVSEKLEFIERGLEYARAFRLPEKAAILSGGRLGDIGRHPMVDRSLADAELTATLTGQAHMEVRIEDAVGSYGVIIAPDGICGNLIFRTLALVGGGHGHGAPVINIERVFVDSSRASPDYSDAILLAASLSKV